jgi:hypothetical protein
VTVAYAHRAMDGRRTLDAPLVALLALGALGSGCCSCLPAPDLTDRRGEARTPGPAPEPIAGGLRVLHAGDIGLRTCQQERVTSAIGDAHAATPFHLTLFAGDNLYYCGPSAARAGAEACAFAADGATVATPPTGDPDPIFADRFEGPLSVLASGGPPPPVLLVLGNHDVKTSGGDCTAEGLDPGEAARRKACLEVAHASPLWSMPGRHWVHDQGPARFIGIDTNLVAGDYAGFTLDDEVAFVAQAAQGCDARACFIVGHHPPATAGPHWKDLPADGAARQQRLVDAAGPGLRAWLAGHEHDLQHVRTPEGLDVLVSGAGCFQRWGYAWDEPSPGSEVLFAATAWAFGVLTVGEAGWQYRFQDEAGRGLYCCAAAGAGQCLPVACP